MRGRRRLTRAVVALLVALIVGAIGSQSELFTSTSKVAEQSQPGLYQVSAFYDGDTIAVDMNGNDETIRMIGVDTPETHDPRKPVQCFGQAASQHTKQLIAASRVRLEADPLNTNRDRYSRLLRYVYLPDGTLINAQIIKDGYGFAYTLFPFGKADEFRLFEQQAREAGRGLWSTCQIETTKAGNQQTNSSEPSSP